LIKYIKNVLWRVAKRLSYAEGAECLKVKYLIKIDFKTNNSIRKFLRNKNPLNNTKYFYTYFTDEIVLKTNDVMLEKLEGICNPI